MTVTYGQAQSQQQHEREESATCDLEDLRILCLDNDPLILDGMEQLLCTMGAQVVTASNREQLIARFAQGQRPDIVLADYHLDDGDTGLSALQEVRQLHGADTPCIIISADDSDVIRDRAKAVGYRFLPKPVNATRLRAFILALTRG